MFVSKRQPVSEWRRVSPGSDTDQAVAWLRSQLAWERVLDDLRRDAGIEVPARPSPAARSAA